MLKILRNRKLQKKIWIVLAIIIVPAFTLWGTGNMARNKQGPTFAGRIMGKKISLSDLQDSMAAVRNRALMQFGDKFSEIEKYLDLESQGWERLILLKEAEKRRVKVTDKEVIDLVQSYPFFQNKGGFDNHIYAQMLQYVFHTQARVFEEETRQDIMLSKLYKEITEGIKLNDKDILDEYKKANEEISVNYIAALTADFNKDIFIKDDELKDYFNKNSLQFKKPLSFNLEYVELSSGEKDDPANSDKIKKIYKQLTKKVPFDKVAKENNLTLKETGLFPEQGPVPGIGWSGDLLNLLIKSKPGRYLGPLHIDKNYYILRIKERKEPFIPDFEKVKGGVKDALMKDKSKLLAKEKIENCLKHLKDLQKINPKSIDFNAAAKIFGLKSDATGMFKFGSYIEGIGASDKFWTTARGLEEFQFSEIIETPSGFYILKLKSLVPSDEKKFEQEKTEFSEKLLLQKKQEAFTKFGEDLRKQAQKN